MTSRKSLKSQDEYTVGWIAALPIERAAATAMLDERHAAPLDFEQSSIDTNSYTWGRVNEHNVVIASLAAGVYGTTNATTTALGMLSSIHSIKFGLRVGIGAGFPNDQQDIRLGDVAVAQASGTSGGVVQYDLGKARPGGQWERRDFLARPPEVLLKALGNLQAEHELSQSRITEFLEDAVERNPKFKSACTYPGFESDRLFELTYDHVESKADSCGQCDSAKEIKRSMRESNEPDIHYGIIASGNKLVKDAIAREKIIADIGHQCICFEMEAAGLMNDFPCLVIRGIANYADSHKNDNWQRYASATAAAFAKELLNYVSCADVRTAKKDRDLLAGTNTNVGQIRKVMNQTHQSQRKQKVSGFLQALYTCPYAERKDRNTPVVSQLVWQQSVESSLGVCRSRVREVSAGTVSDRRGSSSADRTICYFFFKDDIPDQRSSANAICALLRQISLQKPYLLQDSIISKFDADGDKFVKSFSDLWNAFISITGDQNIGEILCILDALDECQDRDRDRFIQAMRKLGFMEPNRSKVKFLSTSRPYDDIRRGFRRVKNHLPIIHLGGEDEDEVKKISQEINLVIQHRVHQIGIEKDLQPDECTFVEEQLTSIPQRTYLWVCLTLDVIQKTPGFTRGGVRNAVGQIPETLDEAYERILERSADKNKARKVLHIITAAVSPLSIGQMSVALAVRENHRSFEDLQEELEPLARFQNTIRDLCGLFIIIVDSKIYFLHQTAKDFLVSTETTPFLQEPPLRQHDRRSSQRGDATLFLKWKHSLQPKSSHRVLAKSCIWFLKLITSGRPLRRFMRYSAMNWATHFREAGINSTETMTQIALKICNPDSEEYQIWFKLQEDPFNCLSLSINSLFVASCLGIEALVELLLEKGADIEAADPQGRTPLWMAVCSGHEEITRLLLKKGAKIDVRCEGETLLSEAILSRNETAIRLLLERGAKLDMRSSLFLAASVGNIMIARILLKMGAEIDRKNDEGDTPLALAALSGEVEMIRMLLEKGAEVDTKNNSGKTALLYAARNGDEIVARMLLEKGADVDAKDNNGETALFYAAENGEEIVAKLLLEVGAEVDAKDNNGETALFCVAKNGKEIVARMLLKLGTGFDTTPLYSAIMYEREAVVKLLLRKGANVNARNNNGESPLSMAASLADDKIARLLKDWNPRKRFS